MVTMRLESKPFNQIKKGYKTMEVRLNDEKRKKLKINGIIKFINTYTEEELKVKILELLSFCSFKDLFDDIDNKSLSGKKPRIDRKNIYLYYSKEQEAEFGVLGIKIKLVK